MSLNFMIADAITRIRNGQRSKKAHVILSYSKFVKSTLKVLQSEGYIRAFEEVEDEAGRIALKVDLKYKEEEPAITGIELVSRPGCRVYSDVKSMPKVMNGLGIIVVSTPKGVMSDDQARNDHVGGELLFKVY